MNADIILRYFPNLSDRQVQQYTLLGELYPEWNAKINVISRKDIDNLYVNHILHSLSIAAFLGPLQQGTSFMDMGTGGGFPGIPLAIFYPECTFHLLDRIGKKIRVASEIAKSIGLANVTFQQGDIKECRDRYNYVVSRAVMPLNELLPLVKKNIIPSTKSGLDNKYSDGLICLKGTDIANESRGISLPIIDFPVNEFFHEPHFAEKSIIYIPM